jgi:hypothetical protein
MSAFAWFEQRPACNPVRTEDLVCFSTPDSFPRRSAVCAFPVCCANRKKGRTILASGQLKVCEVNLTLRSLLYKVGRSSRPSERREFRWPRPPRCCFPDLRGPKRSVFSAGRAGWNRGFCHRRKSPGADFRFARHPLTIGDKLQKELHPDIIAGQTEQPCAS